MTQQFVFQGISSPIWFWSVLLAALAAAVCIVILYQYERKLVPPLVGFWLLTLRLVGLGMLLVTMLEPTFVWVRNQRDNQRVLLALDVSESMETADLQARPGEKLRIARALKMIGNAANEARLDRWQLAFDEGKEPDYVDPGETEDPEQRAEIAKIRQESLGETFREVDRLTRREVVEKLLKQSNEKLIEELQKIGEVDLITFAGNTATTGKDQIGTIPESIDSEKTDLSQVLTSAGQSAQGTRLKGVVLLTDGRDNAGRDSTALASRLGQLNVPVYPILIGSTQRPTDLGISDLEFPATVFRGDKPLLKAKLHTAGFEGQKLQVTLEKSGGGSEVREFTPTGGTTDLDFPLATTELGRHIFTLKAEPQPGETRADNNSRSFAVTVVDDVIKAALWEGEARWEFRFIENALKRDKRVRLQSVVLIQPYLQILTKPYFESRIDWPAPPGTLEESPLADLDLLILGDIPPGAIPEQGWNLIERFVGEAGGTLVVAAGKRWMPQAHNNQVLKDLLPVSDFTVVDMVADGNRTTPEQRGFRLHFTADAEEVPMFQFNTDKGQNRLIWDHLPGHLWGIVGKAKPGATVFSYGYQRGEQLNLELERQRSLFTLQNYGLGQVLWIGIDSTWRWRHRAGDQYHHRFWGQLGRWAASNKATAGNQFVKFGPVKPDVEIGEDVLMRARWTQAFLRRFPNVKAKAEVFRTSDPPGTPPVSTIPLESREGQPLIVEGKLSGLGVGEYRVRLLVEGGDIGPEEISTGLFVSDRKSPERNDLAAHPELLKQIAQAAGGKLLMIDEAESLPELLSREPAGTKDNRQENKVGDMGVWLILFLLIFTIEWVTRKLYGLP